LGHTGKQFAVPGKGDILVIPIVFVKAINAYSELLGDIYGGNPAHAF
jgi:hypothetical protein